MELHNLLLDDNSAQKQYVSYINLKGWYNCVVEIIIYHDSDWAQYFNPVSFNFPSE